MQQLQQMVRQGSAEYWIQGTYNAVPPCIFEVLHLHHLLETCLNFYSVVDPFHSISICGRRKGFKTDHHPEIAKSEKERREDQHRRCAGDMVSLSQRKPLLCLR